MHPCKLKVSLQERNAAKSQEAEKTGAVGEKDAKMAKMKIAPKKRNGVFFIKLVFAEELIHSSESELIEPEALRAERPISRWPRMTELNKPYLLLSTPTLDFSFTFSCLNQCFEILRMNERNGSSNFCIVGTPF